MRARSASSMMAASAAALLLASLFGVTGVLGQDAQPAMMDAGQLDPATIARFYKAPGYSPYAGRSYPTRVYWGDQHVHTGWSVDAGMSGATLTPEDAVRFARGEQVISNTGQAVKLHGRTTWIAVTDHSDGVGVIAEIKAANPELMADKTLKRWHDLMQAGPEQAATATMELINAQSNKRLPPRRHGSEIREVRMAEEQRRSWRSTTTPIVHGVHRLRVDVECGWRRRSASQRHLPRRPRQG